MIRARTLLMLVGATLVALAVPAAAKSFRIDDIDATRFVERNEIRFFVDLLDDDGRVVPDLAPDALTILIDDKAITGSIKVEPYFETPESVAVAVIIGANFDYRINADTLQAPPLKVGIAGAQKLAQRLRPTDRVALWVYDEKDFQRKLSFQEGGPKTGDDIERIELKTYDDEGLEPDPNKSVDLNLYERLLRELGAGIRDEFGRLDTTRRKVIVIMSDGLDSKLEKDPQRISKLVDDIAKTASESGIRVYSLGYATIATKGLPALRDLSNKTNGFSLLLSDESSRSDIERTWEELAEQIKRQYVVTLKPEDLDGGRRVKFQMKAKVAGAELTTVADRDVHLAEKPFAWKTLLMWIGIGLGGLILLILIYKLIAGYLRRRAERPPPEPEVVVIESGPQGPSRGRLQVTKGPCAGMEYYLTEAVTTIGSMEGNSIVIDDSSVSRRHAGIKIEDLRYELADLGSTNGVLVNGRKITKQFLKDGDEIRIGNSEMVFLLK
ncbi:MAG: hypothetical protein AMXMBFR64_24100 [Myxococcales bacterium]